MRQRIRRVWPWLAVVAAALFLTYGNRSASEDAHQAAREAQHTAAAVQVLANENHRLVKGIQNAITLACEVNGNALRQVIREEIKEGITPPNDPRLRELLPDASPTRVREIVEEGNAKRQERLLKAHNVNCVAVYKKFNLP